MFASERDEADLSKRTVWILGDQLNRNITSLEGADPSDTRILMVQFYEQVDGRRAHRQRLHLFLAAMRRFANDLRADGFEVDERLASDFADGIKAHRKQYSPKSITAMYPLDWDEHELMKRESIEVTPTNQMLCNTDEFSAWAGDNQRFRMEDFYRWQRKRLDILMDGDAPAGGAWNFDPENRKPPPKKARDWYEPIVDPLDELDAQLLEELPKDAPGADPVGLWATTREQALARLDDFVERVLPEFGPYEDAMLTNEFRLAHSMLSHCLNAGLLSPDEVVHAAEEAYRSGHAPIASVEGFVRQIIGWREYIWNVYWHWMPDYRQNNVLNARRSLPPMFDTGETNMNCMSTTLADVHERAWCHHIQRLMVLGNFTMLAGIKPAEVVAWMTAQFVDGNEWVMLPNVIGMALYADGGRMSTKPYAAGGAYINRMSDYCKNCVYDPKKRVGDDACPYTTLYWNFIDRHRATFAKNSRMFRSVQGLDRLKDLDDVRARASDVLKLMHDGKL